MKKLSNRLSIAAICGALAVCSSAWARGDKNIVETAVAVGSFKTLATALAEADLVNALQGKGPFTVFAPTDDAFAKLPGGLLEDLLQPDNKSKLERLLKYHVMSGKVSSSEALAAKSSATLEGQRLRVRLADGTVKVNEVKVITADIEASNGVIHMIDEVLLPPVAEDPVAKEEKGIGQVPSGGAAESSERRPIKSSAPVDVVFVLDTTGSMAALIAGAKQKIWSIAADIRDILPDREIRLGLVAFRDRGEEYVTRTFDLSADADAFYLQLLSLHAAGGGDTNESVNQALAEAVGDLTWSGEKGSSRFLFLVGDAPPKMYKDDVAYPTTCERALKNGIIINAVQAGDDKKTAKVWREIAKSAGGDFVAIPHGGGMKLLTSPFDKRIHECTLRMHETVMLYGSAHAHAVGKEKLESAKSGAKASVADRAAHLAETHKGHAITGNEDLVTEMMEGRMTLADIKMDHLPKKMQSFSREKVGQELKRRSEIRRRLQKEMSGLVKERQGFVAEKRMELPKDSFDQRIREIIRGQAEDGTELALEASR